MAISLNSIKNKLSTEPEKNILIILRQAHLALGGLFCIYNKIDSEHSVLTGRTSEMADNEDPIIDTTSGHICYEATITGTDKHVIISDLNKTDFFSSDPAVAKLKLRSYLGVPVRVGNKVIGSLAIVDTIVREFTDDEIETISNLALLIMLEEAHIMTTEVLKRSEYRYDAIFENANDCIMMLQDNKIVNINNKGCELFGYDRDELSGKTTNELSPDEDEKKNKDAFNQYGYLNKVLKGEPQRFEWVHQKKNGSLFYCDISLTKLEGSDEYNVLSIIRDISQRKEFERKLINATEKAKESNRLMSVSLASMSHELRTPLNSIIGFSDLLLDEDTTEDEKEMFSKLIQTAGKSLMQLIGDIIDISKIEAGKVTIQKTIFNVNSFLQEIFIAFKQEKKNRDKANIELKLMVSDQSSDLKIRTDQHRLRQVISNLLTNSLKFIDKGFIEFGYSSVTPEYIQFYVKDTGVGIATLHKEKIFEHYNQDKDTYNRNREGTGLGLAISKSFVDLLGGTIWVDSELEEGSTFYFTIPFDIDSGISNNNLSESLNMGQADWSTRTILIVDDVSENYIFLKGLLKHTNASILRAQNGKEAVDLCKKKSIDIVLMDIRMPVMDGFEAIQIIKQINPDIPIIAQTAFASHEDKIKCFSIGCDDYLKKPINYNQLFSVITKYLG